MIDTHRDARRPRRTRRVSRAGRILALLVVLLAGLFGSTLGGEPAHAQSAHAQSTKETNIWPFAGFSEAQIQVA